MPRSPRKRSTRPLPGACRERRITMAPDRKNLTVALKNQFAMNEKVVDGEPSWVNVRLK